VLVQACIDYDAGTATCVQTAWVEQPGLLPPLSAAEGGAIASAMVTVCATAWALKALRRYIWPRA